MKNVKVSLEVMLELNPTQEQMAVVMGSATPRRPASNTTGQLPRVQPCA